MRPHRSVSISREERTKLKDLAKDKGYIVKRGPYAGEGSLSKLLQAIASGEVTLIRLRREKK